MRATYDGMKRLLANEPQVNAEEAIFWYAYAWQGGPGTDLYSVFRDSVYVPNPKRVWADDPLTIALIRKLERFVDHPVIPPDYKPVRFADVREGDMLIAGTHHLCILNRFPGKVVKFLDGELTIPCNDGLHRLVPDSEGNVLGFRI